MNLQRLEVFEAIIRNDFNVSKAAQELRQSQPGLSKHLSLLEQELGFSLFVRKGKRLFALSEPGAEVHRVAARMLRDRDALATIAQGFSEADSGSLTIATTHTQARYALPPALVEFKRRFPKVEIRLHQGSPAQVISEVRSGKADIAIATEGVAQDEGLVSLACYEWNRSVIAPHGHSLLKQEELTLESIARYPIVTYSSAFTGRSQVNASFSARGLAPKVVLSAIDADIIKTYVRLGFGVGVIASMAFDEGSDEGLGVRDASHLFADSTTWLGIARGAYLRGYVYSFIELLAPHLSRTLVEAELNGWAGST